MSYEQTFDEFREKCIKFYKILKVDDGYMDNACIEYRNHEWECSEINCKRFKEAMS